MISNEEKLLKDRVQNMMKKLGISITSLSASKSEQVMIGRQIDPNKDTLIPYRTLYKLLYQYPSVSADWLILGEGSMWKRDHIAPNIYNQNNQGTIQMGASNSLVMCTTTEQMQERIRELETDKAVLQALLNKIDPNLQK